MSILSSRTNKEAEHMIKGINRQIIEINDTGNTYYEKAWLVVRPEFDSAQKELLEREAAQLMKAIQAPSSFQKKNVKVRQWIKLFISAAAGAVLAYLLLTML